jgi:hypothetical protein
MTKIDEEIKKEAELNEKADELGILPSQTQLHIVSGRLTEDEIKLVVLVEGKLFHGTLSPVDSTLTDLMINRNTEGEE